MPPLPPSARLARLPGCTRSDFELTLSRSFRFRFRSVLLSHGWVCAGAPLQGLNVLPNSGSAFFSRSRSRSGSGGLFGRGRDTGSRKAKRFDRVAEALQKLDTHIFEDRDTLMSLSASELKQRAPEDLGQPAARPGRARARTPIMEKSERVDLILGKDGDTSNQVSRQASKHVTITRGKCSNEWRKIISSTSLSSIAHVKDRSPTTDSRSLPSASLPRLPLLARAEVRCAPFASRTTRTGMCCA